MLRADAIRITPEVLALIAKIDEFKGAWRAHAALAPDRLSALRRVATVESVGSSTRIEGSRLSDREVERLLSGLGAGKFETRDEQEVAGYAELMDLLFQSWDAIPFNENHIKQLHQILLRHSRKDEWHRGNYKTAPNNIAAFDADGAQLGVVSETAPPFDTPRLMSELVQWVSDELEKASLHPPPGALAGLHPQPGALAGPHSQPGALAGLHPLLVIGIFVVVFLEIHPFQDGNGRLSRALTTLLLLRTGYSYVPYSSLESVIEASKEGYYLALRQTQGTIRADAPDWQPWLLFFLRSLAEQVRRLEKKIELEKTVLAPLPELSLQIVEFVREHGRVTMAEATKLTGASRNTLKKHLRDLTEMGHLKLHGGGRGAWYGLA
jgi:Fic family protein